MLVLVILVAGIGSANDQFSSGLARDFDPHVLDRLHELDPFRLGQAVGDPASHSRGCGNLTTTESESMGNDLVVHGDVIRGDSEHLGSDLDQPFVQDTALIFGDNTFLHGAIVGNHHNP